MRTSEVRAATSSPRTSVRLDEPKRIGIFAEVQTSSAAAAADSDHQRNCARRGAAHLVLSRAAYPAAALRVFAAVRRTHRDMSVRFSADGTSVLDDVGMGKSPVLAALEFPFIFSQHGPLTTHSFMRGAKRFDVNLDATRLERLHSSGFLSPLAVLTDRPHLPPSAPVSEPPATDSTVAGLRMAQQAGRIFDPTQAVPPGEELRFDESRTSDPPGWWNGAIYSRWQLLDADWLRSAVRGMGRSASSERMPAELEEYRRERGEQQRRLATALTLLEPRYLPEVERGWLNLRSFHDKEWHEWRASYDPHDQLDALDLLGIDAPGVLSHAEGLLSRARRLDPSGQWSSLIRRAPQKTWASLTGDLAASVELRVAAEILLLFYADLGEQLPDVPADTSRGWHPLDERISNRAEPLDRVLMGLGVSPHPGALLLVEGETERRTVLRILELFGMSAGPDLVHVVTMNGVGKKVQLLGAAAVAPLLGRRRPDGYDLLRPPCRLIVAVDPEGVYRSSEQAEAERQKVVRAIAEVVRAQAADADTKELDSLVEIRRWSESCFEFEHFSDLELFEAIKAVHTKPDERPDDKAIVASLRIAREKRQDVKDVWWNWAHQPSKPLLADALWAVLKGKIERAATGNGPMPQLAALVEDAYNTAQRFSRGSWLIGLSDDAQPEVGRLTE